MSALRVLVVDDSEIDQLIDKHMIEQSFSNVLVEQAFDGQEALEYLQKTVSNPPNVIFLDINMPRMNGLQFLHAYQTSGLPKSEVVMVTSSFQASDRDKCLTFDCVTQYLTKPPKPEDFEQVLKCYVG
jgi:CheY-like chemotaxis protein